ncbi:MAG TPA: type I DNA topoisomerase [Patescibacteria group bacterium]|nr:type I DNA topoisomerase [Patescibacteria group bacterium]
MASKNLVIVESPTKAKTIGKILGDDFVVTSSMGHLIDLPQKELGVDIEKDFKPHYVVLAGRKKVLSALKKEAADKQTIYIATDPDREGEAIGWHIRDRALKDKNVVRVVFHEITAQAVKEAFKNPRDFDAHMIEAQGSRRVLDRIVGYFLSPLLWKKLARGLSAGRVQSVALRLIIERERQIQGFVPQEYWEIEAQLKKKGHHRCFKARLDKIAQKKAEIKTQAESDAVVADLKGKDFVVADVGKKEKKRNADAPFITSTLQQESFNKLRFNATKTMIIAQQLYEGIDIGESGPVGLITYMRTDSPQVAPEALKEVRALILKQFGKEYVPEAPNVYKIKKHAQEAHEAIRPTLIGRTPESLQEFLTPEQYKLYGLIYRRFLASQMTPARYLVSTAGIKAGTYLFVASGTALVFDGFTAAYNHDQESQDQGEEKRIPELEPGEVLDLEGILPSQHFTKPPPRFSDSSLVKALEEEGIGRPSTYAPIISTIILRDYARRLKGYFHPTELGFKVCDMLVEYFPAVMDVKFTAHMEDELDEIEEGRMNRLKVLEDFYAPFKVALEFAQTNIKKEIITTNEVCDKCGKPMIVKWGRKGKFLSCSAYPECKNAKSITSGVKCPEPGCPGELVQRRSKRGFFYGCTSYPKCRFVSKTLPEDKAVKAAEAEEENADA